MKKNIVFLGLCFLLFSFPLQADTGDDCETAVLTAIDDFVANTVGPRGLSCTRLAQHQYLMEAGARCTGNNAHNAVLTIEAENGINKICKISVINTGNSTACPYRPATQSLVMSPNKEYAQAVKRISQLCKSLL